MSFETKFKTLEAAWKTTLPAAAYKIVRVDGRNFSKFTKEMDKPFDIGFIKNMDQVAKTLCQEIQGAQFAYVQSDEISVLIHNAPGSQQWFGGDVLKTVSISAGLASAKMSLLYTEDNSCSEMMKPVVFDSRAFTLEDKIEVTQYFLWRQGDAWRNAVSMAAGQLFSHKQLMHKTVWERLVMMEEAGVSFHQTYMPYIWHGRVVVPTQVAGTVEYTRKDDSTKHTEEVMRRIWQIQPAPLFDWDTTGFLHTNVPEKEEK